LVGGTTDNGERLQVYGGARIQNLGITFLNTNQYTTLTYISNGNNRPNTDQTNVVSDALLVTTSPFTTTDQIVSSRFFRINMDGNDPLHAVSSNTDIIVETGAITNSIFRMRTQGTYTDLKQNNGVFSMLTNYEGATMILGIGSGYGELRLKAYNSPLSFYMTGSEIARFTSANNLLIGTTTDGGQRLQVSGNAFVDGKVGVGIGSSTAKLAVMDHNPVLQMVNTDGRTVGDYIKYGFAVNGTGENVIGNFSWVNVGGADGTHDFTLSMWTSLTATAPERLRVVGYNGNVLIGTATDDGIHKLQVVGAVKADDVIISGDSVTVVTPKTPSSSTDTGTAGEIAWDANYVYVCVANNTWKRSAISSW
jgi:hypothetical protein